MNLKLIKTAILKLKGHFQDNQKSKQPRKKNKTKTPPQKQLRTWPQLNIKKLLTEQLNYIDAKTINFRQKILDYSSAKQKDPEFLWFFLGKLFFLAALSFFPYITSICLFLIYFVIARLIKLKYYQFKHQGLLTFFPEGVKKMAQLWIQDEPELDSIQYEHQEQNNTAEKFLQGYDSEEEQKQYNPPPRMISIKSKKYLEDDHSPHIVTRNGIIVKQKSIQISDYSTASRNYEENDEQFIASSKMSNTENNLKRNNSMNSLTPIVQVNQSKQNQNQQNDVWDKFDKIYQRLKSNMPAGRSKIDQLYRYVQMFRQLDAVQNNTKKFLNVSETRLMYLFLLSTLMLIAQSVISKKSRELLKKSIVVFSYVSCATISTITLSLMIYKLIERRTKRLSKQN